MEHSHNPLIYGFLLSFLMFGIGISFGYSTLLATDWQSLALLHGLGGLSVVAGIIMLRRTFKIRDECPICKNKYHFGKKKNVSE